MYHDLIVHRGDDDHFLLDLTSGGVPVALDGAIIHMAIKPMRGDIIHIPPDNIRVVGSGQIAIMFSYALTKDFDFRTAKFDVRIRKDDLVDTVLSGSIHVKDTITPMTGVPSTTFRPTNVQVATTPARVITLAKQYMVLGVSA